jgi:ABC-type Na+ transport system ATPase subunit NatA
MTTNVVDVSTLSRSFGEERALEDVSFQATEGRVYGLVGATGAGKTTLLTHLLGLLRAATGSVRVFGLDPVRDPVGVLRRVGYLSEDRELPEWMRVDELMRYTQAYHPTWDASYARQLLESFALDPSKKVKELSKGMRAQAGLVAAVAHRPELLILDEPSSGLDAVVRRDILDAIVRTVADDGRTVIFSSHLLDRRAVRPGGVQAIAVYRRATARATATSTSRDWRWYTWVDSIRYSSSRTRRLRLVPPASHASIASPSISCAAPGYVSKYFDRAAQYSSLRRSERRGTTI